MLYVQTKKDLKAKKSGKGLKKPLSKEMRAFIQGAVKPTRPAGFAPKICLVNPSIGQERH